VDANHTVEGLRHSAGQRFEQGAGVEQAGETACVYGRGVDPPKSVFLKRGKASAMDDMLAVEWWSSRGRPFWCGGAWGNGAEMIIAGGEGAGHVERVTPGLRRAGPKEFFQGFRETQARCNLHWSFLIRDE